MRFRVLVGLTILLLVELVALALRYESIATLVQLATIIALLFPVYAFWRRRLEKKRELIDAVRMWVSRFQHMTEHIPSSQTHHSGGMAPNEVTHDVVASVQKLAEDTADHLSEALAKGEPIMGKLLAATDEFIFDLRNFAKTLASANVNGHPDGGRFLYEVEHLLPKAKPVHAAATNELRKFDLRNGVPERYSFWVELAVSALVVFLAVVLVISFL